MGGPASATVRIKTCLRLFGESCELSFEFPARPVGWLEMMAALQHLTDVIVDAAETKAERQQRAVTCSKGCGVCCSQIVPIAEFEAHHLARLVRGLPASRRATIRPRFVEARRRLEEAGLWTRVADLDSLAPADYESFGIEYFRCNIPCPFLEAGACSIHPQRPIACREFLVTSAPSECADPAARRVDGVELPAHVSGALFRATRRRTKSGRIPLVLALEWAEAHPLRETKRPAQEMLREIIEDMTGRPVPTHGGGQAFARRLLP